MKIALILIPQQKLFPLDYIIPEGMIVQMGELVIVPYRNKKKLGIVLKIGIQSEAKRLKEIESIFYLNPDTPLKENIIISEPTLEFITKAADYYIEEQGSMAKLMLPVDLTETLKSKNAAIFTQNFENINLPVLSLEQQKALEEIIGNNIFVLHGITGSGKTEIYFYLLKQALEKGQQSLLMLPEIALSKQIVNRFEERFGSEAVVWHSAISSQKKHKILLGIMAGTVKIVIGTRSALFLPYKNLGQIIIDEEHDHSYKQDEQILYNARDMAILRSHIEKIPILLGSATPSLETFYNIQNGRYKNIILGSRFADASLPEVVVIDMKKKPKNCWISEELKNAITMRLAAKEQVMLFLNRKGYAPLLVCSTCGHRAACSSCSTALVYHKAANKLQCHHCGYNAKSYLNCVECSSENSMIACGPGVERIAEEVAAYFPDATIQIMTREEMNSAKKASSRIAEIMSGQTEIIIGTQIITKGYHFPKLTLVGVIDTDVGLAGGDLRAAEKTFQLLYQVGGRAGREQIKGKMYLQTFNPESEFIRMLKEHDFNGFMNAELETRQSAIMPPIVRMAAIIMSGKNELLVKRTMLDIARILPKSDRVTILGPVPAILSKLQNRYRYRIMLIADKKFNIQAYISTVMNILPTKIKSNIKIDIDPYNFY